MALIVETGAIIVGANSYVSLETVRAWAIARGIVLPVADADLEQKVYLAMDWFEGYSFKWTRVDATQALSFPRVGVTIDGVLYLDTEIAPLIQNIICQATCDAVTIELEPSYAGSAVGELKRKKLDVMEKEYFKSDWARQTPRLTKLIRMLEPLVGGGLASGRLDVRRV